MTLKEASQTSRYRFIEPGKEPFCPGKTSIYLVQEKHGGNSFEGHLGIYLGLSLEKPQVESSPVLRKTKSVFLREGRQKLPLLGQQ